MAVRNIQPGERAAARLALAVDDARLEKLNVITDEDGGFATYTTHNTIAGMGAVLPRLAQGRGWWRLALGVVERTRAAGHTRGEFTVDTKAVMRLIERTFKVAATVIGEGDNGPAAWRIEVDLADAEAQLRRVL